MAQIADLEYLRRQWARKQANRASGTQVLNQGADAIGDAADNSPNVFADYQNTLIQRRQAQEQNKWEQYQAQAQAAQQRLEDDKSWWQKLVDWGAGGKTMFAEGVMNVADNFWDAAMFLVGGIAGGWWGQENDVTRWAQESSQYDWQAPVSNVMRKAAGLSLINPEIYKSDYWTSGFGSPEDARKNLAEQNRFTDNEAWQNAHNKFWGTAGELVGEIALTKGIGSVVKGGKVAQVAAKGIQSGIGSAGASFERATNEGASFQEASRYAAVKGTISGITSAALYSAGAQGYGPYAQGSTKFGSFVFDKTANAGLSKAVDILQRAGGNALVNAAGTAADPFLKQLTYNANAIDEAYGSDEARANTFKSIAIAGATSFATSALLQGVPEAVKRVKLGKSGYALDYALNDIKQAQTKASSLMNKAAKAKDLETAQKYMKEAQTLLEKANRYNADFEQMAKDAIWENGEFKGFKEGSKYADLFRANQATGELIKKSNKTVGSNIDLFKKSRAVALYRYHIQAARSAEAKSPFYAGEYDFSEPKEDGSFTATEKETGRRYAISTVGEVAYYKPVNIERGIANIVDTKNLPTDVLGVQNGTNTVLVSKSVLENAVDDGIEPKQIANALKDVSLREGELQSGNLKLSVQKSEDGKSFFITDLQFFSAPKETKQAPAQPTAVVPTETPTETPKVEVADGVAAKDPQYELPKEYVGDVASANNVAVYAYKSAIDSLKDLREYMAEINGVEAKDTKITFGNETMTKSADKLFRLLNKKNITADEVSKAVFGMLDDVTLKTKSGDVILSSALMNQPEYAPVRDAVKAASADIIKDLITSGKPSLKSKLAMQREAFSKAYNAMKKSLQAVAREYRDRIAPVRTLKGLKKSIPAGMKQDIDIAQVDASAQLGSYLASGILNLKSTDTGYSSGYLNDDKTLAKTALTNAFNLYTEDAYDPEKGNVPLFPYDEGLKEDFQKLIEMWPEPVNNKYPTLPADVVKQANKVLREIYRLHKQAKENYVREVKPTATKGTARAKQLTSTKRIKAFVNNTYVRNFASRATLIRAVTIGTQAEYELVTKMENASQKAKGHVKDIQVIVKSKIKELGAMEYLGKSYKLNGVTLYGDDLVDLYGALLSPDNYDDFDKNGLKYEEVVEHALGKSTFKYHSLAEPQTIGEVKKWLDENMPKPLKKLAEWVFNDYYNGNNADDKQEFGARKFELALAKEAGRHDTTLLNEFYPRGTAEQRPTNVTKVVKAPKSFPHEKERVKHHNRFVVRGFLGRMLSFANDQATLRYVYPQYTKNIYILGAKNKDGESLYSVLYNFDPRYAQIVMDAQNGFMGVDENNMMSDPFIGKRASTLLSYNPGTPPKQVVSLINANFSLSEVAKGVARRMFGSEEFKEEYAKLKQMFANVKYRNANKGNLDIIYEGFNSKLSYALNKVIDIGMWGTLFADEKTIDAGLAVAMSFAMDEGLTIGSQDFRDTVQDLIADFILVQIGNTPLTASNASSGKAGMTAKFLTFMNGAQRAALSSMIEKYLVAWAMKDIENVDFDAEIQNTEKALTAAKEELEKAENKEAGINEKLVEARADTSLSKDDKKAKIDELKQKREEATKEREEAEEKYAEAKGDADQAKQNKRTSRRFKAQGGKKWWLSSIVALALSGAATAFFSDLAKKIRGTKDWRDWNAIDFVKDAGLYSAFGWLPVASTITNAIQGYDTTVPSGYILSTMSTFISSAVEFVSSGFTNESAGKKLLRSSIETTSLLMGLPISNIYKLAYGAVRLVSPETADKMRGVFYVNATTNANIVDAIEKGDKRMAVYYIEKISESNCGALSSSAQEEFYKLMKDGENPIPSSVPTRYTNSKGQEVIITWTQQQNAKKYYSRANAVVSKAIMSAMYRKLTVSQRASLVRSIYSAYRQAALAQSVPNYDATLSKYAMLTKVGGSFAAELFVAVSAIRALEATDKKSKKQLAVEYVNRLKLTKAERLLVLYMAGYSVDEDTIKKALKQKGMSQTDIAKFLVNEGEKRGN